MISNVSPLAERIERRDRDEDRSCDLSIYILAISLLLLGFIGDRFVNFLAILSIVISSRFQIIFG